VAIVESHASAGTEIDVRMIVGGCARAGTMGARRAASAVATSASGRRPWETIVISETIPDAAPVCNTAAESLNEPLPPADGRTEHHPISEHQNEPLRDG
jgi:hypothetical protein